MIQIVVFGATGDLSRRKLVPALFSLFRRQELPDDVTILGFSRGPRSNGSFRQELRSSMMQFAPSLYDEDAWRAFSGKLHYQAGRFDHPDDFNELAVTLRQLEGTPANRLYYLATPPQFFPIITTELGRSGLVSQDEGWVRVVVEKPFGTDLTSARALNQTLRQVFEENQIYRIDHYLGKETVQNILTFRFANAIFEPVWNRNYIDHVQITVAEEVGLENRASYYDQVGVVRDMFQNHLLQLLSLVAMEPPTTLNADDLRDEKVKVIKSLKPIPKERAAEFSVLGQYRGYQDEPGVTPGSQTATYAAMRLFIENWRWEGVPFYLRSGKHIKEKCTEIVIQFKYPPRLMFSPKVEKIGSPNILALCLQPDEGIHLRFEAKVPGSGTDFKSVDMEFHYRDSFKAEALPDAYERLLMDALKGDLSLFTRGDRNELAWEFIDPILAGWEPPDGPQLAEYEPGSWGPIEADQFLARSGRTWLRGCGWHE